MSSVGRGGLQFMLIIWLQGDLAAAARLQLRVHPAVGGHLHAAHDGRFPGGRPARRIAGRPLRRSSVHGRRHGPDGPVLCGFGDDPGRLQLLGVCGAGLPQRPRRRHLHRTQHRSHHVQRAGRAARRRGFRVRATFFNAGSSLSIGIFFSLMVIGLANTLPSAMSQGLQQQGVPAAMADQVATTPPVGSLFAAFLGYNPMDRTAGSGRRSAAGWRQCRGSDRNDVLPAVDHRPVPRRPGRGVRRRRDDDGDRRSGLVVQPGRYSGS